MATQMYDEIEGSERGFVELAAWQRALAEPPTIRGFEAAVVRTQTISRLRCA